MKKIDYSKQISRLMNIRVFDYAAYTAVFLFCLAGIVVSLNRYWQFEVFYYDFGIFDQAIWSVSRFQAPIIEHLVVGGKWIFADHFNPSLFLLSPFYWLTDKSEVILILQALSVGLSGLVLYKIGLYVLKNKFYTFTVLLSYFFFAGLQNAVITDFHEVTVATLPLMLSFYGIITRRLKLFIISFIIFLGFKESLFLVGIGLGIFIFFYNRKWMKVSILVILLSIIWGVIVTKYIIPYFSGGVYQYSFSFPTTYSAYITDFILPEVKQRTLFYSFYSFSFLPLLSPAFYALFFQDLAVRFYPLWPTRWELGLHYSALLSVFLAVSSLFSFQWLLSIKRIHYLLLLLTIIMLGNSFYLSFRALRGPLWLSTNPAFYQHSQDFGFLTKLIDKVPETGSVMAQNNLASRFTHRRVYLLRSDYEQFNPDYIVIDNRAGQSPNNFFGTDKPAGEIINSIQKDTRYTTFYKSNDQYIFKKK